MARLWEKDYSIDALLHAFTVGNDYQTDAKLVTADCTASIAHVSMLHHAGLLEESEAAELKRALKTLISQAESGEFVIKPEDEDCHTAIEQYLIERLGETGKKVHLGRSRNDQVQAALRLWGKDMLFQTMEAGFALSARLRRLAEKHIRVPMPGRTHMQKAMPSSVGLWAASYAEELLDESAHLFSVLELIDQSPLGAAASYGVPLPLDREYTARLLGFSRVQNNVLYANNSRGKFEGVIVDALEYIALTLSKIAQDLILFSMPEFGYFSLPDELCTGSSIMPQKKNPDGLELTRSRAALVSSCGTAIKHIIRSLPSGYNRDFQDTKEPFIQAAQHVILMIRVMDLTIEKLQVHEKVLGEACTSELYATDHAISLVKSGMSFREAYRQTGAHPEAWESKDPLEAIMERKSQGTTGNLGLDVFDTELKRLQAYTEDRKLTFQQALSSLTGRQIVFFSI